RRRHDAADRARRDHLSALSRRRAGRRPAGADLARLPQGHALCRRGTGLRVDEPAAFPSALLAPRRRRLGKLPFGEAPWGSEFDVPFPPRLARQLAAGRAGDRYADSEIAEEVVARRVRKGAI